MADIPDILQTSDATYSYTGIAPKGCATTTNSWIILRIQESPFEMKSAQNVKWSEVTTVDYD